MKVETHPSVLVKKASALYRRGRPRPGLRREALRDVDDVADGGVVLDVAGADPAHEGGAAVYPDPHAGALPAGREHPRGLRLDGGGGFHGLADVGFPDDGG